MEKVNITAILGTVHEGRRTERVFAYLTEEIKKREDIEVKFFDARDFEFKKDWYGEDVKDKFPEYRDAIIESDGIVIVTPEYNHGYPGDLKKVLDVLFPEYKNKAAGLVTVSSGAWGGTRVTENILPVLYAFGLVTAGVLNVPNINEAFTEDGRPADEEDYRKRVKTLLDKVVWMARTLKYGRENVKVE